MSRKPAPRRPDPPRELRGDRLFRWIGGVGALLIRLWGATLNVEWIGTENLREVERTGRGHIWTFWHGGLLTLAYGYRGKGIVVLVSSHKDGEIISQIICRLGYGVVRGSSTRGGMRALMQMARVGRQGHTLAVTPDGPRGPRRELQSGVLHIAQRSGLPIVPMAVEAVRRTELASWDRFLIPHPWSRVVIVLGPPIWIPSDWEAAEVEREGGSSVTAALREVEASAAAWRSARTADRGVA
jgi:lysophospholipid acyltransferase (LPLAT)-like uncharacterized protein